MFNSCGEIGDLKNNGKNIIAILLDLIYAINDKKLILHLFYKGLI